MAIFGNSGADVGSAFNVRANIDALSNETLKTNQAIMDMAGKFQQTNEDMAKLRSTTTQILSQYGTDEKGKPSLAAPKYIHDIYKQVQKEGGVEGLSKSSLMQAIQGYETGYQIENQRQSVLHNQRAGELEQIQLEEAKLKAQEQRKMIEANDLANQTEVSKTKQLTTSSVEKKTVKSSEYGTNLVAGYEAQNAPKIFKPNAYGSKPAPLNYASVLKGSGLDTADRDSLKTQLQRTETITSASEKNANLASQIASMEERLKQLRTTTVTSDFSYPAPNSSMSSIPPSTIGSYGIGPKITTPKNLQQIKADEEEEKLILGNIAKARAVYQQNSQDLITATKTLPYGLRPAEEAKPKSATVTEYPKVTSTTTTIDKSEDEIIKEEYGVLTSRLKSLGKLPLNWSEDTFRQMRGYSPKVEYKVSNGVPIIGFGGKWEIASNMMKQPTVSEQIAMEKQSVYKSAIRSDRLSDDNWEFQGDMRVDDANTAGKIGKEAKDLTRSIDALDRLIDLGNTGKWDSLLPTQKAGIIDALTNSVRAAGRTEIAGSGAFSEKDADYLNSVIPSFASLSGTAFREQAIAKLTEYRERIQKKVTDFGTAYGFSVQRKQNSGLGADQEAELKFIYTNLLKQGLPAEQARQMALQSLYKQ